MAQYWIQQQRMDVLFQMPVIQLDVVHQLYQLQYFYKLLMHNDQENMLDLKQNIYFILKLLLSYGIQ